MWSFDIRKSEPGVPILPALKQSSAIALEEIHNAIGSAFLQGMDDVVSLERGLEFANRMGKASFLGREEAGVEEIEQREELFRLEARDVIGEEEVQDAVDLETISQIGSKVCIEALQGVGEASE